MPYWTLNSILFNLIWLFPSCKRKTKINVKIPQLCLENNQICQKHSNEPQRENEKVLKKMVNEGEERIKLKLEHFNKNLQ